MAALIDFVLSIEWWGLSRLMAADRLTDNARVNELLAAGKQALAEGKRKQAHDLWREAAILAPYDERVWIALFKVLDTREDRRVCLENIIAINPLNAKARRLLRGFATEEERQAEAEAARQRAAALRRQRRRRAFRRALFIGLLLGVVVGVVISVLAYSYGLIELPTWFIALRPS